MSEVRSVSSTGGEKGTKEERFDLLPPEALAKIARHYGIGASKYAAHNWRRGYEWSKSFAALQRHAQAFWSGEDIDAETGSPHMAAVAFHAMTLLVFMDEQRKFDDRYRAEPEKEKVVTLKVGVDMDAVKRAGEQFRDAVKSSVWTGEKGSSVIMNGAA